jgi:hypothetical protein
MAKVHITMEDDVLRDARTAKVSISWRPAKASAPGPTAPSLLRCQVAMPCAARR